MQDRPEGCILCNLLVSENQEVFQIPVERLLYEFCCLCFGLSPAPLVLTKLLKAPIFLLRKLNVKIIIYLNGMLLMTSSLEDL